MKVLVLSNVPGSVDKLVSILQNGHSVVAKESDMKTDEMVSAVARAAPMARIFRFIGTSCSNAQSEWP